MYRPSSYQQNLRSWHGVPVSWCCPCLLQLANHFLCSTLYILLPDLPFAPAAVATCSVYIAPKEAIPLSYTLPKACSSIFSFLDVQGTFVACVYAYSKHGGTQRVPDPSFPREPVSGKQETCSEEHILLPFFFLLLAEKLQMCSLDVFLETSLR